MSYNTLVAMSRDGDLQQRLTACAASVGIPNPQAWVQQNMWALVQQPDMALAYAGCPALAEPARGQIGKREDVIGDNLILVTINANKPADPPA